jgi:hypothetical protein
VGAEAGNFVKGQARAAGDDQVVVGQHFPVLEQQTVAFRLHPLRRRADEADAVLRHQLPKVEANGFRFTPVHGDPGIGRREFKHVLVGYQHDLVPRAQLILELECGRQAADAAAQHDDVAHGFSPVGRLPAAPSSSASGRLKGVRR